MKLHSILQQIAVLAEYGTTGPDKGCKSPNMSAGKATTLRNAISQLARQGLNSLPRESGEAAGPRVGAGEVRSSNLVSRLRDPVSGPGKDKWHRPEALYQEAADEIERLRSALWHVRPLLPSVGVQTVDDALRGSPSETTAVQWKEGLPYINGTLASYDQLVALLRPEEPTAVHPKDSVVV